MTSNTPATTAVNLGPGWLTFILIGMIVIGEAFEFTRPLATGVLLLILFALLLYGYPNIHNLWADLTNPLVN